MTDDGGSTISRQAAAAANASTASNNGVTVSSGGSQQIAESEQSQGLHSARHNYGQQALFQQVLPHVRHVLQVLLETDVEETVSAVTNYVVNFRWENSVDISQFIGTAEPIVVRARIMEAVCHWIRGKSLELDAMIPATQSGFAFSSDVTKGVRRQLQQISSQDRQSEIPLLEFINTVVVELVGRDAASLANAIGGYVAAESDLNNVICMIDWPPTLLCYIVRKLEEIASYAAKVVMKLYSETGVMDYDHAKNQLSMFIQHFTLETNSGLLEPHDSRKDKVLLDSPFRIDLVDSFGKLTDLLMHLENLCSRNQGTTLAFDFEGVKLCRHGALCLVQLTCCDDPRSVYVLDVHVLGKKAFTFETPNGTSMKSILEDQNICKVWFDPRNDVDALYHQFGISPNGIFDLQLAEVAERRNRGFNVNYVQGLHKCLTQSPQLSNDQKTFAQRINELGKRLFEPQYGGNYEIFQHRPLNSVILVYAAHDSRYMLVLYEHYTRAIGQSWVQRVVKAGKERGQWCMSREYQVPSSDAPEF